MRNLFGCAGVALALAMPMHAAEPVNVPPLMTTFDGRPVASVADWENVRRPELLAKFLHEVYGIRPEAAQKVKTTFRLHGHDAHAPAMGGRAVRHKVIAEFEGPYGKGSFPFTAFVPQCDKPVPAFLLICNRPPEENIDPDRKVKVGFWPAEEIVERGYAAIAFSVTNLAADVRNAGFDQGVFPLFQKASDRDEAAWGTLSAWAWGASRVMDWIERQPFLDAKHVAVVGHSRGGKTALLTGVADARFAMACVNDSGCSGAKLNHIDLEGDEEIGNILKNFPYWFCGNYRKYVGREMEMDFDNHELIALMAPRLVAVASATEDAWAGPQGEWWGAKLASPAWELYGKQGLVASAWPRAQEPQQDGCVAYHLRAGKHCLTRYDWKCYMDFADRHGWNAAHVKTPNARYCFPEPKQPWLDATFDVSTVKAQRGLRGRATPLVRLTGANVLGDEAQKTWRATAWRNERVYGQFVVWSDRDEGALRLKMTDLTSADGAVIPASSVRARFVRHTLTTGDALSPDVLDDATHVDMPAFTYRPVWLTVNVPRTARATTYRGTLTVQADKREKVEFPVELTVRAETLPEPAEWKYVLDLWQHPWAVARYHGVKPFSSAHFRLMEPLLKELASSGQKTITTTITDLPWNHQNYDAYETMVTHTKNADGTWTHDYDVFDRYVTFAQQCGIGPQIHCYTMATWGHIVYYTDGATGDRIPVKLVPGTPEHEKFWGPFLEDFARHLEAKDWMDRTYIALDERSRAELMATAEVIKRHAPKFKLQLAGNKKPSTFAGVTIDSYSTSMHLDWVDDAFLKEVAERRAKGFTTTFYICCGPAKPNTFTHSPFAEQQSLGLFAAVRGLDGMLRWAAFNWPRDPFFDSNFGPWPAGDTYLLYPNGLTSTRWEMLRDGIELNEKIRALRTSGRASPALEDALRNIDLSVYAKGDETAFRKMVDAIEARVDADSRKQGDDADAKASSLAAGGDTPVAPRMRGHENTEWSIAYDYHLTDAQKVLPRVLLVGDSICNGYHAGVRKLLEGKMNVSYWASSYCVTSEAYLRLLAVQLDSAKFDVVHINNGLHSTGVALEDWKRGLAAAFDLIRAKQPAARIVWASSTPVASQAATDKVRLLNAAAQEVVAEKGDIATDDLFGVVERFQPAAGTEKFIDGCHHVTALKQADAEAVVEAVLKAR